MATAQLFLWTNTFYGFLISVHFGTLTRRSDHPASPVLLTKNGPLRVIDSNAHVRLGNKDIPPIQSLRIALGRFDPKDSNHSLYRMELWYTTLAILGETSEETSNLMIRLVFRPYTQVWSTICTSVTLRASIGISSDFTLLRHSSPSFGF